MKTVYDLSDTQLSELKQAYIIQCEGDGVSYSNLVSAEEIPDDIILNHYDGIMFTDDDFCCSCI